MTPSTLRPPSLHPPSLHPPSLHPSGDDAPSAATLLDDGPGAGSRLGRRAWMLLSLLLVGGVLFGRLWWLANETTRAAGLDRAAIAVGVQPMAKPLQLASVDVALELPPAANQPPQAVLGPLLASNDVVLVNYWATWCPPCLQELASLVRLGQALRGRKIAILAVSYDDDWASQQAALREHAGEAQPAGIVWARDPQGQDGDAAQMMRTRMGTEKLPETWVVRRGEILGRFVGAQRWDRPEMVRYLDQAATR